MASKTLYSTKESDKTDKLDKTKLTSGAKKLLKSRGINKRNTPKRMTSKSSY